MNKAAINWAEVYDSLNINTHKQAGKWILRAVLVVGAIPVAAAFLVFSHQPEIGLFLTFALHIITIRLYWNVVRQNKRPKVVVGAVVKRITNSHTNRINLSQTIRHFISIDADDMFEIDRLGKADYLPLSNKPKRYGCPSTLYNSLIEGQSIVAVVLPQNNSIAQIL